MAKINADSDGDALPCAIRAWNQHEQALSVWLFKQSQDQHIVHDILQEVFIRVMSQGVSFCDIQYSKAWMFRVAQNLMIDYSRQQTFSLLDGEVVNNEESLESIDVLAMSCLPRVLSELEHSDREIITACDLQNMNQQAFAVQHGLTLPAVKSRIRRARQKLRHQLQTSCKVKFDENQQVCCFTPREKK